MIEEKKCERCYQWNGWICAYGPEGNDMCLSNHYEAFVPKKHNAKADFAKHYKGVVE